MERASGSVKEATIRGGGAASARRSKCSVCGALACDGSVVHVCGGHNGGLDEKGGISVTQMRLGSWAAVLETKPSDTKEEKKRKEKKSGL